MARPHRLFLDANVLFSAAYRVDSGLLRLWSVPGAVLMTSGYARAEALANLSEAEAVVRLDRLCAGLALVPESPESLPAVFAALPDKDAPILTAALAAGATHLLTGDRRHFGPFFGCRVEGLLILPPGAYLHRRR
jgi:hypothetical protein